MVKVCIIERVKEASKKDGILSLVRYAFLKKKKLTVGRTYRNYIAYRTNGINHIDKRESRVYRIERTLKIDYLTEL